MACTAGLKHKFVSGCGVDACMHGCMSGAVLHDKEHIIFIIHFMLVSG